MSTPKPGRSNTRRPSAGLDRRLDDDFAVQGEDDGESLLDAMENADDGLAALEANNGDAFSDAGGNEDVIPLPDETPAQGSRRP